MYELGAITGLRAMGFRGRSKKIESLIKKLDIEKAPGEDFFFGLTLISLAFF